MCIVLYCWIFFVLAIVHRFFVVGEIFLLSVFRAGTSIPPMFLRAWLLILLLFLSLRLRAVLTFVIYLIFVTWLKFGDFYFFKLEGLKNVIIGWAVKFIGIVVNLGSIYYVCLLFCLLFRFNLWLFFVLVGKK